MAHLPAGHASLVLTAVEPDYYRSGTQKQAGSLAVLSYL